MNEFDMNDLVNEFNKTEKLFKQYKVGRATLQFDKDLSENYRHYFWLLQGCLKDCRKIAIDTNLSEIDRCKEIVAWLDNLNGMIPEIVRV